MKDISPTLNFIVETEDDSKIKTIEMSDGSYKYIRNDDVEKLLAQAKQEERERLISIYEKFCYEYKVPMEVAFLSALKDKEE